MFSLPSLAPQDSYTLWYTSSSTPHVPPTSDTSPADPGQNSSTRRSTHHTRTPLARLRLDEEYQSRRLLNISNFGASWIKPPGYTKSLFQLREEEREMKEQMEAMRREALAQELAEAEAQGMEDGEIEGVGGEEREGEEEEARDLDDDVPDADGTGLDLDDDDEEDEEDEDEDEDEDEENEPHSASRGLQPQMPQDVYREALARGHPTHTGQSFDGASLLEDEEEENSGILQEEDLVHEEIQDENGDEMGMGIDLDADVPDADGYEHTDTEDELTSSDEESADGRLPQHSLGASMVRSDGTQNSMDLRSLVSGPSSQLGSQMGASSSPRLRRPPRS